MLHVLGSHQSFFFFFLVNILSFFLSPLYPSFKNFSFYQQIDWHGRILSLVHSVINTAGPFYVFFLQADQFSHQRVTATTPESTFFLAIAAGYFTYDFFVSIYYIKIFGVGFLVHSVYCGLSYIICSAPVFHFYGAFFLLFEGSTLFLNIYSMSLPEIPHENKVLQAKVNKLFGIIFAIVFTIVRMIFGNYYYYFFLVDLWDAYSNKLVPTWVVGMYLLCVVGSFLLNFVWFSQIVKAALGMSGGNEEDNKKDDKKNIKDVKENKKDDKEKVKKVKK